MYLIQMHNKMAAFKIPFLAVQYTCTCSFKGACMNQRLCTFWLYGNVCALLCYFLFVHFVCHLSFRFLQYNAALYYMFYFFRQCYDNNYNCSSVSGHHLHRSCMWHWNLHCLFSSLQKEEVSQKQSSTCKQRRGCTHLCNTHINFTFNHESLETSAEILCIT